MKFYTQIDEQTLDHPEGPMHKITYVPPRFRGDHGKQLRKQLAESARQKAVQHRQDMHDPWVEYRYYSREHEEFWKRRAERDPRYAHLVEYDRDGEPYLSSWPVPYYPHQHQEPNVEENKSRSTFNDRHRIARVFKKHGPTRAQKIEEQAEIGNLSHKQFDRTFIKNAIEARNERGWSQKDLSQRINYTLSEIKDFETGKLQFDRALKTHLITLLGLNKQKK